jgi:glycosyltransferase involved in cell wall biosynthesis
MERFRPSIKDREMTDIGQDAIAPFLFILKHGPIYKIDGVDYQLEVLSRRFQGELWVTGSFAADVVIGRFRLVVVKEPETNRWPFIASYYRTVLRRARALNRELAVPRVIITYDPFRNGLLGRLVKRAVAWPLIVEINGVYGSPDNYKDSPGLFARKIRPGLLRMVGRYVIRNADGIRLLFEGQLKGFSKQPGRAVVRQYFDAVRLEMFEPAREEKYVLLLGHPFYRKGVDLLLEAFRRVNPDFPDWRLVLIGHELANHIPTVPYYLTVSPGVPYAEAAYWVRRCAFLVLASRSEAMGRVLIEAAAAAKPRVAADVDGTHTVVEHESDGLMFKKGDIGGLEAALRRLMGDPELRTRLGRAARERALVEFGADRYLAHVSGMVSAVIQRAGGQFSAVGSGDRHASATPTERP